jgi:hypothetical protein
MQYAHWPFPLCAVEENFPLLTVSEPPPWLATA